MIRLCCLHSHFSISDNNQIWWKRSPAWKLTAWSPGVVWFAARASRRRVLLTITQKLFSVDFLPFFLDLPVLCWSSLKPPLLTLCPDSRLRRKRPELLVVIDPAAVITGSVSAALISSVSSSWASCLPLCVRLCCSSMFPLKQELDDDVSSVRSYRVCTGWSVEAFWFLANVFCE